MPQAAHAIMSKFQGRYGACNKQIHVTAPPLLSWRGRRYWCRLSARDGGHGGHGAFVASHRAPREWYISSGTIFFRLDHSSKYRASILHVLHPRRTCPLIVIVTFALPDRSIAPFIKPMRVSEQKEKKKSPLPSISCAFLLVQRLNPDQNLLQ